MSTKKANEIAKELGWEKGIDYPVWGHTEEYLRTISRGYLLEGEKPKDAYWRVASTVAKRLNKPEFASIFFDYIWKSWLCLASPVLSNTGTERGLPISCFGIDVGDSIQQIGEKNLELMLLAKHGGGVGVGLNMIREAGTPITNNGTTDGVVPFAKIYDSTILATNQGAVRRGAASVNLNIDHGDFDEWLEIREAKGDVNKQCLNLHQCAIVDDSFMIRLEAGEEESRRRWSKLLRKRNATGEPYIMYRGNVNKANPEAYQQNRLKVFMTNICVTGDTIIDIKICEEEHKCRIDEVGDLLKIENCIFILSYNESTKESEWKLITDWGMTDASAKVYEITDEASGNSVKCTANHKFLTKRGWIEAGNLKETDELVIK
jgi:ribonucleoside-diphosphate reductase alpha chain